MTDLLDVNLWLSLVDQRHLHHPVAQAYWSQNGVRHFAFCRVTMLGLLRLITSHKAVANPKTHATAWSIYHEFKALPNIRFLSEPTHLETTFHSLTTEADLPNRMWTDAYLAAFAINSGSRLVSFYADFARFPGLHFLHLKP
jgi:toxin-antitoxin system PIN domain toxin